MRIPLIFPDNPEPAILLRILKNKNKRHPSTTLFSPVINAMKDTA